MKYSVDVLMGSENLDGNYVGLEFFKENFIIPSAPVPGINNDHSLNHSISPCKNTPL